MEPFGWLCVLLLLHILSVNNVVRVNGGISSLVLFPARWPCFILVQVLPLLDKANDFIMLDLTMINIVNHHVEMIRSWPRTIVEATSSPPQVANAKIWERL